MQYIALIYSDETFDDGPIEELLAEYQEFTDKVTAAGVMRGGDALELTSTATTVRMRDGELLLSDGPFAETKEQLGGYYLFECADLDEAVYWAKQIPSAKYGSIEVRPIMPTDG